MALLSIQLCHIDRVGDGRCTVTCHSDDGKQLATFICANEADGLKLRNAIRDHAERLKSVGDYRD
jgi:hypothetical protein